jgi:N-acetylglucosaminyldiphosphoundecaprenol N-acetyl-beta-D-mannosaminyltransferase
VHRINILGVPIDCVTFDDAVRRISEFFRMEGQFHITTPNPEMLVEAQRNDVFREVLKKAHLNLPDGIGLVWAMRKVARCRLKGKRSNKKDLQPTTYNLQHIVRVTGIDVMTYLCSPSPRICPPERIFLLGAAKGVAEKAAENIRERNHLLKDIGTYAGSPGKEDEDAIIQRINAFSPTLLFVAFGAPAQDLWIARNVQRMPSVKVAMGVGGAFDFMAGQRIRAPQFLRKMGLEWLWRLICEPKRVKRIWRAVVVFPWMIVREYM